MRTFIALEKAYRGGRIIEKGERVVWPDELEVPGWLGGKTATPAKELKTAAAVEPVAPVEKPKLSKAEQVKADKAAAKAAKGKAVAAPTAEPFADAPAPVRVQNEIAEALGTIEPDWVAPTGEAQAVAD